jgi:hypothetical protein
MTTTRQHLKRIPMRSFAWMRIIRRDLRSRPTRRRLFRRIIIIYVLFIRMLPNIPAPQGGAACGSLVILLRGFVVFGGGLLLTWLHCRLGRYFSTQYLYWTLRKRLKKGLCYDMVFDIKNPPTMLHLGTMLSSSMHLPRVVWWVATLLKERESVAAITMVTISGGGACSDIYSLPRIFSCIGR